ncbi:MAG: glycerophosphodiester phosphodiesterase [Hydrogenophaga sp.]|uniref:glycerophosphodiester phosphodiesterase n=1 Tax=Hydrogenophaga sp. TaxID=1904254 RepID=UPI001D3F46E9|nr:glycerophosphodiester phosphodiesterase [Hydrogenophaga sp.]MBX3610435.1 glycerophosphodiester phosphodiesterase [Hydrogenophaga sp.]
MQISTPPAAQRLTWLRWGCTTALGLSLWCAGAALAFDLQGHRGARALAPENTLAGFERALAIGVSTLELDVVLSADGMPVVSHDTAPNPDITRDAEGRWLQSRGQPFHSLTLAQIAEFDVGRINPASRYARDFEQQQAIDGQRIPTLDEVFALVRRLRADHVRFNIELKRNPMRAHESPAPDEFVHAVAAVIARHGMGMRCTLQSFDWAVLKAARRVTPELPLSFLTAQRPRFNTLASGEWTDGARLDKHHDAPALVAAAGGKLWSPSYLDLDQHTLERARAEGLRVIPWTVNEVPDMERLIDWGVDGLITDHPERLRQVLQQRGIALPPMVTPAVTAQRTTAHRATTE